MKKIGLYITFFITISSSLCFGQEAWVYKRTYESQAFTNNRFFLFTAADINNNGSKELIFANFGRFGDHLGIGIEKKKHKEKSITYVPSLFVTEWDKNEMKIKFSKRWVTTLLTADEAKKYFLAFEAKQMVPLRDGNRMVVETIPPYLGLEWRDGKYILREQQGPFNSGPLVGSWVFPWLSPSCDRSFPNFPSNRTWPRECIVGIRDFFGNGKPRVVTIREEEIVRDKKYRQTLRVRKYERGFPIEWEQLINSNKYYYGTSGVVDRLNYKATDMLLMNALTFTESDAASWFLFKPTQNEHNYVLQAIKAEESLGLDQFDLPDLYLRTTQNREVEEIWGYRSAVGADKGKIMLLRKVTLKKDLSDFVRENIDFPHHDSFLGVGFFDLQDIDGDGLDEVILVEETGTRKFTEEHMFLSNVQDYIHILKWDGAKYRDMWVSPPYTKRGTKFLVEDIKNTGKKQLVVLTPYGTIQIWERQ